MGFKGVWVERASAVHHAQNIPSVLIAASVSHAFQLPSYIGGAGGSSAAFWIAKAKERHGLDVAVDIYERSDYIGGRSTTVYPYNDTAYEPVELGASIFVQVNKNMQRAVHEFNLSTYGFDQDSPMGIWDGERFLYTETTTWPLPSWLNTANVRSMIDKFVTLYESDVPSWSSIENLIEVLDLSAMTSQTGAEYFQSHGVSRKLVTEIIEAATRVNYAQNVDSLHGLEAACSLAASGGKTVKGGNWQIFDQFVKRSGARVFLKTEVVGIQRPSEHFWTVITRDERRNYDAFSYLPANNLSSLIPPQPYIHLHVTLLTTTAATPNPEYFGYKPGASVPTTILTSSEGARQGGNASEFNSVTYHGHAKKDTQMSKEWIVKIFSMERISDEWLENMFQSQIGWVFRKEWDSYPVLPPTDKFPPIKLDEGLFYVNAFEP
ncbi:Prenylcysteine lyase-domain-containing protein [Lactifluus volemus]|nr:Prenylcysteine lyase-domain-containing protein [Lactifluus volemus]